MDPYLCFEKNVQFNTILHVLSCSPGLHYMHTECKIQKVDGAIDGALTFISCIWQTIGITHHMMFVNTLTLANGQYGHNFTHCAQYNYHSYKSYTRYLYSMYAIYNFMYYRSHTQYCMQYITVFSC